MIENKKRNLGLKIITNLTLSAFALLCIIPIIAVVSISLSNESNIVEYGYSLFIRDFDLSAYSLIFDNPAQILNAYKISFIVTILGGIFSLTIISLIAYPLSRKDFKQKNKISMFVFFTLLFNGGMVPFYILVSRYLGISDTILSLILPYSANAWHILILRTFFQKIPISIIESGKIDGASEYRIFSRIVVPLSKPGLATIGLFIILLYWNDWWLSLLFIENEKLIPLQYMLYRIMANLQFLTTQMTSSSVNIDLSKLPNESVRMAMCVVAAGPMLFIFPFFQKYFVKGLTVGSIKG